MILEFRVSNFRSIRDEVLISFVASKDKKLAEQNLLVTGLTGISHALKSLAIYGANASGKSTLLSALAYMRSVVAESATMLQLGQTFNIQPFKLDAAFVNKPSFFEITFLFNGIRHQYGFEITPERIVDEWLLVYKTSKPQQWFRRVFDEKLGAYEYEFSSHLSGPRKVWQESTRANALFLSTAAQLNSELLGPLFRWLAGQIIYFNAGFSPAPDYTTSLLQTDQGRQSVRDFLASADISIEEITSVAQKGVTQNIVFGPEGTKVSMDENEIIMPKFIHKTASGSATFELHEESGGTQRLYMLAAPIFDVLNQGRILIVDELDSSLHPILVRSLIKLFHHKETNPKNAQLLFTTHDTSLLDKSLLRKDQIWFIEKNKDQASTLTSLADFSPRETEAWEKGYLIGRYGAIPFIDGDLSFTQSNEST
ncbi:AAA family ATPase [Methylophilus aquaticus]|uniref:ATP-binding protein n=1 Tax=Methylophilus aquaticus TaxID=1971610 RepID=A0ABT9JTI6_9PROT|nr:ATP-binding protein [Methylophilus aquaticus]MDP8567830.1 ATP-binding protein [Methylophilus aquaticus]